MSSRDATYFEARGNVAHMRAIAVLITIAIAIVIVSCSKKTGPSGIVPRSGAAPGVVTLRFVNNTGADVYVMQGVEYSVENKDGRQLQGLHFCQTECGECMCHTCGSPMYRSEKIAPGAALEKKWEGTFYEDGRCKQGGSTECGCGERRYGEDGAYTIALVGARGVTKDDQLDPASAKCTAKGTVNLRATAQTADIPFTCSP